MCEVFMSACKMCASSVYAHMLHACSSCVFKLMGTFNPAGWREGWREGGREGGRYIGFPWGSLMNVGDVVVPSAPCAFIS